MIVVHLDSHKQMGIASSRAYDAESRACVVQFEKLRLYRRELHTRTIQLLRSRSQTIKEITLDAYLAYQNDMDEIDNLYYGDSHFNVLMREMTAVIDRICLHVKGSTPLWSRKSKAMLRLVCIMPASRAQCNPSGVTLREKASDFMSYYCLRSYISSCRRWDFQMIAYVDTCFRTMNALVWT